MSLVGWKLDECAAVSRGCCAVHVNSCSLSAVRGSQRPCYSRARPTAGDGRKRTSSLKDKTGSAQGVCAVAEAQAWPLLGGECAKTRCRGHMVIRTLKMLLAARQASRLL